MWSPPSRRASEIIISPSASTASQPSRSAEYVNSLYSLVGKTAVVTGGTRGIGAGIAVALASAGANIILPLRTPNSGQSTIAKVESLGRRCRTFPCDLSNTPEVSTLIARITSAGERIDILVNCAGWHVRKPAEAYTDAEVEGIWRVNLGGMFILCRDVAAHWFAEDLAGWENGSGVPRKKIINTASVLSFTGGTGLAAYTATKGGIAQVTKTFSNEWAARGINVNAIAPGYIRTDLTRDLQENPDKSVEVMERTPVGRWGETTDLAGLVVLLASGASDFMAGAVVPIDGGYTAR